MISWYKKYALICSLCGGIGSKRYNMLLTHFNDPEKIFHASLSQFVPLLGQKIGERFFDLCKTQDTESYFSYLKNHNIDFLCCQDDAFPKSLKEIPDPPFCLYVKGNISLLSSDDLFAIVGTRKATSYGIQITKKLTMELVEAGFGIVSGLALGIDAVAHRTCLSSKGKTIAVLGCGINTVYPSSHQSLYDEIISSGGAICSEFYPDALVHKGFFVSRNRIISGLSKGTLVIEGSIKSGALITAKCSIDQGKDVFACPGNITSDSSAGPNYLIQQGAMLTTSITDILDAYAIRQPIAVPLPWIESLSQEAKTIVDCLKKEPLILDLILENVDLPISEVTSLLSELEIEGYIERNKEGKYQITI